MNFIISKRPTRLFSKKRNRSKNRRKWMSVQKKWTKRSTTDGRGQDRTIKNIRECLAENITTSSWKLRSDAERKIIIYLASNCSSGMLLSSTVWILSASSSESSPSFSFSSSLPVSFASLCKITCIIQSISGIYIWICANSHHLVGSVLPNSQEQNVTITIHWNNLFFFQNDRYSKFLRRNYKLQESSKSLRFIITSHLQLLHNLGRAKSVVEVDEDFLQTSGDVSRFPEFAEMLNFYH